MGSSRIPNMTHYFHGIELLEKDFPRLESAFPCVLMNSFHHLPQGSPGTSWGKQKSKRKQSQILLGNEKNIFLVFKLFLVQLNIFHFSLYGNLIKQLFTKTLLQFRKSRPKTVPKVTLLN